MTNGHRDRVRLRLRLNLFSLISMPQRTAANYRDMQAKETDRQTDSLSLSLSLFSLISMP